jgi:subtilisin family serine protease
LSALATDFSHKISRELQSLGNDERDIIVILDDKSLPPGLERRKKKAAIQALQDHVLQNFDGRVLNRYKTLNGFSGRFTQGQVAAMAAKKEVLRIETMPIHKLSDAQSHPLAGVDLAHGLYKGEDTVIAIIDDGIDHEHPAFGGSSGSTFPTTKIIGGYDFADYDNDPTIGCSSQSHGTAVAGVAAGDGGGITGTAPKAKILFLKVQKSDPNDPYGCGSGWLNGDIIGALDWLVDYKQAGNRVDVVNMSFAGGGYNSASSCDSSHSLYFNAVQNVKDEGIVWTLRVTCHH